MKCKTIQEVIQRLDEIISVSISENNPEGFFAILYYKVTCRVAEGIDKKEFNDNELMAQLDVVFANRYLEAYDQVRSGKPCSLSWQVAFQACRTNKLIALQHLLLGMNAHINLDLGIAAFEANGQNPLERIKPNFFQINQVLNSMITLIKKDIGRMSPAFNILMPLAKHSDERLIQFSIETARDGAWAFAEQLSKGTDHAHLIQARDQTISALGQALANPTKPVSWLIALIKRLEFKSITRQLTLLKGSDSK